MLKTIVQVAPFMEREWSAAFATVSTRGEPHVVRVFFTYRDGKVYVQTDRTSAMVRHLLRNPKVTIAVYRGVEAVILLGTTRIVDDDEFVQRTQEHVANYGLRLNARGADALGVPLFDCRMRCVVEVIPQRIKFR